jgi:nucleoside-diphosphate-sugar epimerase
MTQFSQSAEHLQYIQVGDINESTEWQEALAGVDTVIHLAARVHVLKDKAVDPLDAFRRVNVLGTERLARMAAKAGVKRFIFISSVKAEGQDAYGVSKREAEDSLARVAAETGLKTVILRPSLVYGQGVKANFKNLIKIVGLGVPLPFKGIRNQRSFIYIGNLVDAIAICITHPQAVGETFSVSDGQDISTPDLMKMIASAMNKKLVLFSLPPAVLKGLAVLVGQGEAMEKLTGSLCVDCSKIRDLLGWKPPFTLQEGIKETVK